MSDMHAKWREQLLQAGKLLEAPRCVWGPHTRSFSCHAGAEREQGNRHIRRGGY